MNKLFKQKKVLSIILIIIVILIVLILLFSYLYNSSSKSLDDFGGVYKMNNSYIRIYQFDEKNLNFVIEGSTKIYGNALIDNNVAKQTINDNNYNFSLIDGGIKFDTNNDALLKGAYKKISNIQNDDYYEHYFGDAKLLTSNNSGIYQSENSEMYLFQISLDNYQVYIKDQNTKIYATCIIANDGTLYNAWSDKLVAIEFIDGKALLTLKIGDNIQRKEFIKKSKINVNDIVENVIGSPENIKYEKKD